MKNKYEILINKYEIGLNKNETNKIIQTLTLQFKNEACFTCIMDIKYLRRKIS